MTPAFLPLARRPGFALVLALVVMSMIVLVVLSLAGLLRIEGGLASVRQSEVMARLNALAALRLAQGALQERLGPDTRVSAPAAIFDNPSVSSVANPGADPFEYPILGVWRSWEGHNHDRRPGSRYAGRPKAPDYLSKHRPYAADQPEAGRFLGWMVSPSWGYGAVAPVLSGAGSPHPTAPPPPPSPVASTVAGTVPLVASAAASLPTQQVHLQVNALADGRPAAAGPEPADLSQGTFAWWVGGENQKARVASPASPSAITGGARPWAERAKTFGRPDLEALGFPVVPGGLLADPATRAGLALLPPPAEPGRLSAALSGASPALARAGFHDVSLHAEGLLTNVATGGLRKDLSLFSETWDWMNDLDPGRVGKMPLFRVKPADARAGAGDPDHDLVFLRPLPDAMFPAGGVGNRRRNTLLYWWADYGSLGGTSAGIASDGGTVFGGYTGGALSSFPPVRSWSYLTDHLLHYRRYVVASQPSLDGEVAMAPPQPVGATHAGNLHSFYERVHRHPIIARFQFVFATGAIDATPAVLVQPVVTLWNPFNVRLNVPSFGAWYMWYSIPIGFEVADTAGHYPTTRRLTRDWGGGLTLTFGTDGINLGPGQTRVYSLPGDAPLPVPLGAPLPALTLQPGYVAGTRAGLLLGMGGSADPRSVLRYRMTKLLDGANARNGIYLDYYPVNHKYSPVRYSFVGTSDAQFRQLYGEDGPAPFDQAFPDIQLGPRAFSTFAFGLRLSNDGVAQHGARTGVRTASKGFLQANPFTTYTELGGKCAILMTPYRYASSDITNRSGVPVAAQTEPGTGVQYSGAWNLVNAPFDMYFLPLTDFAGSNAPQCDPVTGDGYVLTGLDPANGLGRAVVSELPVKPVQSLPELQSCDIRATNPVPPFHANLIGNGDASPVLPPDDAVGRWIEVGSGVAQPRDMLPPSWMQYDDSYCLNHVLFDDWFVSSLAPRPQDWPGLRPGPGQEHVWNPAVLASLRARWTAFAEGEPLPNACYLPRPGAGAFDPGVTGTAYAGNPALPAGYQRVAAHLRVPGQFNVNSTSVVAWRALLGNQRDQKVPVLRPGSGSATLVGAHNALPRMAVSPEGPNAGGGSSGAVLGFAALTDEQLDLMAAEIVRQVRLRGPFLSLSEFVNRRLAPADGTDTDPSLSGAIGMALRSLERTAGRHPAARAEGLGKQVAKASDFPPGILPRLSLGDWNSSTGDYSHPRAAEGSSNFGLPGWPRQADVLVSLAPVLSARDDTFVIRAFGGSPPGRGTAARAWCEAVYQRLPDYIDGSVPPHEPPLGAVAPPAGSLQRAPNVNLGRRFKLVGFRWVNPSEL
jgi:hypothetical protein